MIESWLELIQSDLAAAAWYSWVFWGIAILYPLLMTFLTIGFLRNRKTTEDPSKIVPVTVLVSARNEEQDLPACIESLLNLEYPKDKLQIVLVNDRSDDGTPQLIHETAETHDHVVALNTQDFPENHLKAKARGIHCGMTAATGDWVFITDADAEVHPKWVLHAIEQADEETGLMGGALVVKARGLLGIVERISWSFVQMFNLGMSGWGAPFICVGPNMAIRRDIYEAAGGLENARFTVAEDLALLGMVTDAKKKITTFVSKETTVSLSPVPGFGHLLSQQRRWFRGGIDYEQEYTILLYLGFWYGFFLMSYFLLGWILSPVIFATIWALKLLIDITFFYLQQRKLGLRKHLRYLPVMELYTLFIFIYLPVSFLFTKKIHWKGDGYSIDYE